MVACIICKVELNGEGTPLQRDECDTINGLSLENSVIANVADKVHETCRRKLVCENRLKSRSNSYQDHGDSNNNGFSFETRCIFCGESTKFNEKKTELEYITKDFVQSLQNFMEKRNFDEWAEQVSGRLSSVPDVIGIKALYHKNCRINFRTNKPMPMPKGKKCPPKFEYKKGFLDIVSLIRTKKQAQYSIKELIDEMNSVSDGNGYSFNQMKTNLIKYCGNEIIISTFQNKKTLVTLRTTCDEILNEFYEYSRNKIENHQVIQKVSEIILHDIKNVTPNKSHYPSPNDLALGEAKAFLPETLQLLLSGIITGHNSSLKIVSIGQAIIQTAHRENVMSPLQIALATQMHYFTGSKFVVNTLNAFGFCSTYGEARKLQICASIALQKKRLETSNDDTPVIKYVADNVDHNVRTLDGKNTFHGMGIISIHRHSKLTGLKIPRIKASLQDVKEIGSVEIIPYFEKLTPNNSLFYRKLSETEIRDPYNYLDLLWKVSWSGTTRPGWMGMMQLVQRGSYPNIPTVNFLPIIDMNPTDLTCINSTLHFICKDAAKYNAEVSVTFDQPLWWKARTIIENESVDSPIKRIVLCLGRFHMKMSFLGAIGHIMSGSGLDVVLAQVYAENSVVHMLSGKAYARAIRGYLMVDSALNSIILDEILTDELSSKVDDLLERTIDGQQHIDKLHESDVLKLIKLSISEKKESLRSDPNSRLWLQFMDMMDIVRSNIRADRTGNFKLHLETLPCMLPFYAASGHNSYTKSVYIYLQDMLNLEKTNQTVFSYFSDGYFITRRTDRFWAGLPDDLIIEQMLMRSLKVSGGPTRGRGMDETKLSLWLHSLPARAELNNAIQNLTNQKTETSEQHKECGKSRLIRDNKDIDCIYKFLKERNPFSGTTPLRNIADGIVSTSKANVDQAEKIGNKILKSLEDKNVFEYSFERCKKVVQMSSKNEISIDGEMAIIDPDTLFQRLLLILLQSDGTEDEKEAAFCYELCHKAPSLFDQNGLMREANSPALVKELVKRIGSIITSSVEVEKLPNTIYVLEGDWIIDKIQWQKGESFDAICERKLEIQVKYETAPNKCSALQWLNKEQTAGRKFPYLFSQCEAIHARSLLPCQDTPSTKASYSAEVTAQKELQVLIAIVAGQIESRRLGPRTEVWAEKQFLNDAAIDFEDTEKMLQAAESVCGEYVWGVYDILVLPPSFPFGGMENPCLTFATPTLLAGDKSLANVIAHEIARSWTGNLVTNKTFEHFWLNEGFTVFAERKIVGRLAGEAARQFASIQGLKDLKDCIDTMKPDNPLTNLVVNLDGVDPDDAFSSVPYEKGYAFLYYLEQKVGGPSVFEPFFKTYIANNRYKSIDTNEFKSQFIDYFTKDGKLNLIQDVEWDKWLTTPGMPLVVSTYDTTLSQVCVDLKNRWLNWDGVSACPFNVNDLETMSSSQRIEFLAELVAHETPLSLAKLKAMQQAYNFNSVRNSEIRFRWLRLCIKGKWVDQLPLALKFVTEQGRMKFVRPLYRDMYGWLEARQQAIENFQKNRASMMYVSAYTVAKDLHLA